MNLNKYLIIFSISKRIFLIFIKLIKKHKKMKVSIIILSILMLQVFSYLGENNHTVAHRIYLVKTKLTKEQMETLLHQNVTHLVKKQGSDKKENATLDDDEILQKEIEDEIMEDALHPLDEFHIKEIVPSNTTTLVAKQKTNTRFIDSLYEKRFGNLAGYLTLLFFVIVLIYNKETLFNHKDANQNDIYNFYNLDSNKEYMLVD